MTDSGEVKVLVIEAGTDRATLRTLPLSLAAWQKVVGGYVEDLALAPGVAMYMNEDGKHLGLPVNGAATRVVYLADPGLHQADYIVGDVVIFGVESDPAGGGLREADVPEVAVDLCRRAGVTVHDGTVLGRGDAR